MDFTGKRKPAWAGKAKRNLSKRQRLAISADLRWWQWADINEQELSPYNTANCTYHAHYRNGVFHNNGPRNSFRGRGTEPNLRMHRTISARRPGAFLVKEEFSLVPFIQNFEVMDGNGKVLFRLDGKRLGMWQRT